MPEFFPSSCNQLLLSTFHSGIALTCPALLCPPQRLCLVQIPEISFARNAVLRVRTPFLTAPAPSHSLQPHQHVPDPLLHPEYALTRLRHQKPITFLNRDPMPASPQQQQLAIPSYPLLQIHPLLCDPSRGEGKRGGRHTSSTYHRAKTVPGVRIW